MTTNNSEARVPASGFGRGPIARGLAVAEGNAIEPTGGKFGAGLIRGFSVITRGEALGHGLWIDTFCLGQVATMLNAGKGGSKSRFTHPGLCADGMGKYLGRAFDAKVDGNVVRADLHLAESAHHAPDGDLAAYVLKLAAEDPEAFGTSIQFLHDDDAEAAFENENLQEIEGEDYRGRPIKVMRFRSPDPDNVNHFRHIRLAALRAVDVVDEPAANPTGMFRRGDEWASEADACLSYLAGLSKDKPVLAALSSFGIEPERAQAFFSGFLERHNLQLSTKENPVTNPSLTPPADTAPANPPAPPAFTRDQFNAELKRFTTEFGAKGAEWFSEGKTFEESLAADRKDLQTQLAAAKAENEQLQAQVTALRGAQPVTFSDAEKTPEQKGAPAAAPGAKLPPGLAAFAAANPIPAAK